MDSSLGFKETSNFDVLNNQKAEPQDGNSSFEYKINIKKVGFENTIKPTELPPVEMPEESLPANTHVPQGEEGRYYKVPKELVDYLDTLIIKNKLPLRTLKFDIEFSKSKEEVAGYLEEYIDKSKIIPESDLDKLFGFIGYGRTDNQKDESTFNIPVKINSVDLNKARNEYLKISLPYIEKQKTDKILYAKMMAELGGNTEMPFRDEPKELVEARTEYLKAKKESGVLGLERELVELEEIKKEIFKTLDEKIKKRLEKAENVWNKYSNSNLVAESLMFDLEGLDKIIETSSFSGIRPKRETMEKEFEKNLAEVKESQGKIEEKVVPKEEIKEEAVKVVEKPTVDISVAETSHLEQNIQLSEFEGKNIEISRSNTGNPNEIKIKWGGINIGTGVMTPKGAKVAILKQYKSGFLFGDTPEEKALKSISSHLKDFKS